MTTPDMSNPDTLKAAMQTAATVKSGTATLMELDVVDDNGNAQRVGVRMRTVLAWEKTFPGRAMGQLQDEANIRLSYLYEIAWVAAKKTGQFAGDFPAFCDTYDVAPVEDEEAAAAPDPTQPEASGAP